MDNKLKKLYGDDYFIKLEEILIEKKPMIIESNDYFIGCFNLNDKWYTSFDNFYVHREEYNEKFYIDEIDEKTVISIFLNPDKKIKDIIYIQNNSKISFCDYFGYYRRYIFIDNNNILNEEENIKIKDNELINFWYHILFNKEGKYDLKIINEN